MTGAGFSVLIAFLGWSRGSLSASGLAGAVLTGTVTTARGGYGRAALLVGFFTASSALTKGLKGSSSPAGDFAAKGGRRDIWQVLANGGISTLLATLGDSGKHRLPYVGSLAAVTGDTWATEIGGRFGGRPRHILTWDHVERGMSGGISLPGTLASIAGGGFVGSLAVASGCFDPAFRRGWRSLLLTGIIAGGAGSLSDSIAGATIQERRWCDRCEQPSERITHHCGTDTRFVGGIRGVTNDAVNLICAVSGAGVGWLICRYCPASV